MSRHCLTNAAAIYFAFFFAGALAELVAVVVFFALPAATGAGFAAGFVDFPPADLGFVAVATFERLLEILPMKDRSLKAYCGRTTNRANSAPGKAFSNPATTSALFCITFSDTQCFMSVPQTVDEEVAARLRQECLALYERRITLTFSLPELWQWLVHLQHGLKDPAVGETPAGRAVRFNWDLAAAMLQREAPAMAEALRAGWDEPSALLRPPRQARRQVREFLEQQRAAAPAAAAKQA